MDVIQKSIEVDLDLRAEAPLARLYKTFSEYPMIRFSIVKSNHGKVLCDYATLEGASVNTKDAISNSLKSIFEFRPRRTARTGAFTAVMVVPTGIGAEVGGDSGDACVHAKLIGSVVDTLVTHPNVVNAADLNEMTSNTLYVEGSILSRFMMGTVGLTRSRGNRILLLHDQAEKMKNGEKVPEHILNCTINAASAARVTIGVDIATMGLKLPPNYQCYYDSKGVAIGKVNNIHILLEAIEKYRKDFDCFALHTAVDCEDETVLDRYFNDELDINPWGGLEAMVTHTVSHLLDVRTAHAPMLTDGTFDHQYGVVDPAKSAETLSKTELFCVLKGLSYSPRIITEPSLMDRNEVLTNEDISCLIIPDRCVGLPVLAAMEQGIPVIAVDDKQNLMRNDLDALPWCRGAFFRARNYLEAVGYIECLKTGIMPSNLIRPLGATERL